MLLDEGVVVEVDVEVLLEEGVVLEVDVDCVDVGVIFGVDVMVVEDELEGVVVEVDEGVVVLE